jgi:hypothetical protein
MGGNDELETFAYSCVENAYRPRSSGKGQDRLEMGPFGGMSILLWSQCKRGRASAFQVPSFKVK